MLSAKTTKGSMALEMLSAKTKKGLRALETSLAKNMARSRGADPLGSFRHVRICQGCPSAWRLVRLMVGCLFVDGLARCYLNSPHV